MYRGTYIDAMGRKRWVLGLQVTGIEARDNNLIIYVDG